MSPEEHYAYLEKLGVFESEAASFGLETALQFGFEFIDDDLKTLRVDAKWLATLLHAFGYAKLVEEANRRQDRTPEGLREHWKFKGSAGSFQTWHVGKNDYRVTVGGRYGEIVGAASQFGLAYQSCVRLHDIARKGAAQ